MDGDVSDVVVERVNKRLCPICKEDIIDEDNKLTAMDVVFVEYRGTKQPVHERHIKYGRR